MIHDLVIPVVREVRRSPELDSLFFVRYNEPDWQLRFRILGRPTWIDGTVHELVAGRLPALRERGLVDSWEFGMYQREYERYGGEEGMRLCEAFFLRDSLAVLDLIEAEERGQMGKTRREYSLVFVERFLDLMRFDRERRAEFYRRGYSWALDDGTFAAEDLVLLEDRYRDLREGLLALFGGAPAADPEGAYGGVVPACIARECLEASGPVVDEILSAHAAGRLRQDLVDLAWSLAHMHCNRLAVDVRAEAILRFFMHRLHSEETIV